MVQNKLELLYKYGNKQRKTARTFCRRKLQHLYELQRIDTEIDKIKTLRGELPLEVQDLEDEIAGLETRLENLKNEISEADKSVTNKNRKSPSRKS